MFFQIIKSVINALNHNPRLRSDALQALLDSVLYEIKSNANNAMRLSHTATANTLIDTEATEQLYLLELKQEFLVFSLNLLARSPQQLHWFDQCFNDWVLAKDNSLKQQRLLTTAWFQFFQHTLQAQLEPDGLIPLSSSFIGSPAETAGFVAWLLESNMDPIALVQSGLLQRFFATNCFNISDIYMLYNLLQSCGEKTNALYQLAKTIHCGQLEQGGFDCYSLTGEELAPQSARKITVLRYLPVNITMTTVNDLQHLYSAFGPNFIIEALALGIQSEVFHTFFKKNIQEWPLWIQTILRQPWEEFPTLFQLVNHHIGLDILHSIRQDPVMLFPMLYRSQQPWSRDYFTSAFLSLSTINDYSFMIPLLMYATRTPHHCELQLIISDAVANILDNLLTQPHPVRTPDTIVSLLKSYTEMDKIASKKIEKLHATLAASIEKIAKSRNYRTYPTVEKIWLAQHPTFELLYLLLQQQPIDYPSTKFSMIASVIFMCWKECPDKFEIMTLLDVIFPISANHAASRASDVIESLLYVIESLNRVNECTDQKDLELFIIETLRKLSFALSETTNMRIIDLLTVRYEQWNNNPLYTKNAHSIINNVFRQLLQRPDEVSTLSMSSQKIIINYCKNRLAGFDEILPQAGSSAGQKTQMTGYQPILNKWTSVLPIVNLLNRLAPTEIIKNNYPLSVDDLTCQVIIAFWTREPTQFNLLQFLNGQLPNKTSRLTSLLTLSYQIREELKINPKIVNLDAQTANAMYELTAPPLCPSLLEPLLTFCQKWSDHQISDNRDFYEKSVKKMLLSILWSSELMSEKSTQDKLLKISIINEVFLDWLCSFSNFSSSMVVHIISKGDYHGYINIKKYWDEFELQRNFINRHSSSRNIQLNYEPLIISQLISGFWDTLKETFNLTTFFEVIFSIPSCKTWSAISILLTALNQTREQKLQQIILEQIKDINAVQEYSAWKGISFAAGSAFHLAISIGHSSLLELAIGGLTKDIGSTINATDLFQLASKIWDVEMPTKGSNASKAKKILRELHSRSKPETAISKSGAARAHPTTFFTSSHGHITIDKTIPSIVIDSPR